jgi:hypothetical protein
MRGLICMSHSELTRLEILQRIEDRRLNQTQAATMLGMTARRATRFAWFVPMYIGLPPALLM